MDYAEKDRQNIIDFIVSRGGECDVDEILNCEKIEKFRVYPLIYRMEDDGELSILEFSPSYGTPLRVKLV